MIEIAYEYHTTVLVNENTDMFHCKGDFDHETAVVRWWGREWNINDSDDEIDFPEICREMGMQEDDHESWRDAGITIFRWAAKHDAMIRECSTL